MNRTTRQRGFPRLFVPSGVFPLTSLPAELTIHIATYLSPRGVFALLLTSPDFSHLLSVFTPAYTRPQYVFEDRLVRHYTPLQFFCSRGATLIVKRILERGINPNDASPTQHPPLHHAINFRSAPIVALLLQHGADANYHSNHGNTPLHTAVGPPHSIPPRRTHDRPGHTLRAADLPEIVTLLLGTGASLTTRNDLLQTPLHTACATTDANPEIISALIVAGSNVEVTAHLFPRSVNFGTIGPVFGRWAVNAFAVDTEVSLLHYAANAGNVAVMRLLLEAGASVDVRTRSGVRALDLGVMHARKEVVEVLVAAGADVRSARAGSAVVGEEMDLWEVLDATEWKEVEKWLDRRGWRLAARSLQEWWNQGMQRGAIKRGGQGRKFMGR
ncbi:hypothetical protein Q9L58_001508 [Maublancomyces gigas]|uniref:F-box domain-containing protein n=1 Tax=Discina gigas TaxID=1032678 RepID=A0ABR3GU84_9PEZI